MLIFGVSILALIGYALFDWKYPKPKQVKAEDFVANPVFSEGNYISPKPQVWDHKTEGKTFRAYKFKCGINPNTARVGSNEIVMLSPDEYHIKEFTILVKPENNEVHYVHLGREQYHCDLDPVSNCMCLQELYLTELDQEFLKKLMKSLLTYEILNSYRQDHWENEKFINLNKDLTAVMEAETAT